MSEPLKQKPKMQILMESFDKKYVEELFREGEKMGLWPPDKRQNLQYEYNDYLYVFSRTHMSIVMRLHMMHKMEAEKQRNIARKVI